MSYYGGSRALHCASMRDSAGASQTRQRNSTNAVLSGCVLTGLRSTAMEKAGASAARGLELPAAGTTLARTLYIGNSADMVCIQRAVGCYRCADPCLLTPRAAARYFRLARILASF